MLDEDFRGTQHVVDCRLVSFLGQTGDELFSEPPDSLKTASIFLQTIKIYRFDDFEGHTASISRVRTDPIQKLDAISQRVEVFFLAYKCFCQRFFEYCHRLFRQQVA